MSKFLVTGKNIPYDSNYKNILYFNNLLERTNWINENLENGYELKLQVAPEVNFKITNPIFNNIEIAIPLNNILNKNYIIIKEQGITTFHFINRISNVGNNNKFSLEIELDIFMTYFDIFKSLKNFNLLKGHSPSINYLQSSFLDLPKEAERFFTPRKVLSNDFLKNLSVPYLYVFEKIINSEDGIVKLRTGNEYVEGFRVYVAPIKPIPISDNLDNIIYAGNGTANTMSGISFTVNFITTPGDFATFSFTEEKDITTKSSIYTLLTKYLPTSIGVPKVVFFGENTVAADNLNNDIFLNGTSTQTYSLGNGDNVTPNQNLIAFKITKLSTNTYEFRVPFNIDMVNFAPNTYLEIGSNIWNWSDGNNGDYYGYNTFQFKYDWQNTLNKVESDNLSPTWNSINLIKYLTSEAKNINIITAKVSNFLPLFTTQTEGILSLGNINNITTTGDNIQRLDYVDYDFSLVHNTLNFELKNIDNIELIEGLFPYEVVLENQKTIPIPTHFHTEKNFSFIYYASITPEWEERIKWVSDKYISLTNEETLWTNDKEFSISTDNFEQYKASNPISSKLNPLKDASKIITGGLKGAIFGNFFKGATLGLTGGINNVISRQDIKHQPNELTGSGDILGDLIFNFTNQFMLVKYKYLGVMRDSIKENIYREGIEYENGNYIFSFADIKRNRFNFIRIEDIYKSRLDNLQISKEIKDKFNTTLQQGITVWTNKDFYLNYGVDNNGD